MGSYPLEQMMVETDGPWPFEGPFTGKMTHPHMMWHSISMIAEIKRSTIGVCGEKFVKILRILWTLNMPFPKKL